MNRIWHATAVQWARHDIWYNVQTKCSGNENNNWKIYWNMQSDNQFQITTLLTNSSALTLSAHLGVCGYVLICLFLCVISVRSLDNQMLRKEGNKNYQDFHYHQVNQSANMLQRQQWLHGFKPFVTEHTAYRYCSTGNATPQVALWSPTA